MLLLSTNALGRDYHFPGTQAVCDLQCGQLVIKSYRFDSLQDSVTAKDNVCFAVCFNHVIVDVHKPGSMQVTYCGNDFWTHSVCLVGH